MPKDRYCHSALPDRTPVTLPNNARLALWIVPNVEIYEYLPAPNPARNPWPRMPHPDILGYSHRDYGNRVGIWRFLEVIDEFEARCSVSLNLGVFRHFPQVMEAVTERGWDLICHGLYNTDHVHGMSTAQEADYIDACIAESRALTGRSFDGWFTPHMSLSPDTFDLVAERGIRYVCELTFDEHPVLLNTRKGRLHAMPYQFDINDGIYFNRMHRSAGGEGFARMIVDHFDRLYADSAGQPRVMCIALHPYLIGQPHNIGPFREAMAHIFKHAGVWNATGIEILNHWEAAASASQKQGDPQ